MLAGCGGNATTPSGSNPMPALVLGSSSLNFGSVSLGSSKTGSLTLSNRSGSSQEITVSHVGVSGPAFSLNPAPTLPLVLAAGQSLTVTIKFSPTGAGSQSGTLSVESDAANADPSVPLSGTGLTPAAGQLAVAPSTIKFGNVAVGSSASHNGTLTASGSSVTVSSADWSGQGYSISGISFPVTITAGQSVPFAVTFAPPVGGTLDGSVSFVSNASNSPAANLTGAGLQPQHSVTLSWDASQSQVLGYNIYRGTHTGGPYLTKLNSSPQPDTSFTDSTVQSGMTYFYVATSIDESDIESGYSNQTQAKIP
jgi:hypothetical protein